jgi:hypothetical protein
MACASIGRFRSTICLTDVFVLAFISWGVAGASAGLSIRTNVTVVIFTMAWITAAITRLSEFRRGIRPAVKLVRGDTRTTAILLAGTAPWLLSGFVRTAYPASPIWVPFDVPPVLQALGVALAIVAVAEPFFRSLSTPAPELRSTGDHRFSTAVFIRSAAILLVSGSPVFTIFCGLWLIVALWPSPAYLPYALRLELR